MTNYTRQISIIFIILLVLSSITQLVISSISLNIIVTMNPLYINQGTNVTYIIFNIVYSVLFITVDTYASVKVIYFKKIIYYSYFLVSNIFFTVSSVVLIIVSRLLNNTNESNHETYEYFREGIFAIHLVIVTFEIALLITSYIWRNSFKIQIEQSPLNTRHESLSKEMYKNIISQSKNPDDVKLKKDYERLSMIQAQSDSLLVGSNNENNTQNFSYKLSTDEPIY